MGDHPLKSHFDNLHATRDRLMCELWTVYRKMSDLIEPDDFSCDDLKLWTAITEHKTVQGLMRDANIELDNQ